MNILLGLPLLLLAATGFASEPLRLGEVQTVRGGATYELFIPPSFDPSKRSPALLISGGDAATIGRFKPAASKYGYVLARAAAADTAAMWSDIRKRIRLDNSRVYAVIYGHDAEDVLLSEGDSVAGMAVINAVPRNAGAPTLFFSIGSGDSRYIEMKQLAQLTREQRRRVGVDYFEGVELSADAAGRIIEWFHLDALEQGTAVVRADHMKAIVDRWTAAAASLEQSDPLRAVSLYNTIVANFSAVTTTARTRSGELATSLAYGRAEYAEKKALRWEAAVKKKVSSSATRARDVAAYLAAIEEPLIRKRLNDASPAMRNAASRLLRYAAEIADEQARASTGERKQFWIAVAQQLP